MKQYILSAIVLFTLVATGCKKSDITDTGVHKAEVDMSTYDYLASKPQFKFLVSLIDRENLKSAVNAAKTFFAPTDLAFNNYVNWQLSPTGGNQVTFKLDSIKGPLADSLKLYMFNKTVVRSDLAEGNIQNVNGSPTYLTPVMPAPANSRLKVWLVWQNYQYSPVLFLNFGKVVGNDDILLKETTGGSDTPGNADKTSFVQTSGIITQTGVLHVMANNHIYLFK
jgi:hypothetical protein